MGAGDDSPINPPDNCAMRIEFPSVVLQAPGEASAEGRFDSDYVGFRTYDWQVRFGDESLGFTVSRDGSAIEFDVAQPGPYSVDLFGQVDGYTCAPAREVINVLPADVDGVRYRIRFIPTLAQPAPAQAISRELPRDLDPDLGPDLGYNLGIVALDSGAEVHGLLTDDRGEALSGGAYIRATAVDESAAVVETFADDSGSFVLRLSDSRHDFLVVPSDPGFAPARFTSIAADELLSLTVPAATAIAGDIIDPSGAPIAAARVSLRSGQTPSSVATSDAAGAFELLANLERGAGAGADSPTALTVVPAEDSGLPWLVLPSSAALTDALTAALAAADPEAPALSIAYSPALEVVDDIAPVALAADGVTPLAGVRATWIAVVEDAAVEPLASAGTITWAGSDVQGDAITIEGTTRIAVTSGDDGSWPPIRLPRGRYDVILEPEPKSEPAAGDDGHVTVQRIDLTDGLTDGAPLSLALNRGATLRGSVVDEQGAGLAAIRVTAVPLGRLAQSPGAGAGAVTDSDGGFSLTLVADGRYELIFDALDRRHTRARLPVTAPAVDALDTLDPITLPPAARLTGRVTIPNIPGGAAGVTVQLLCDDATTSAECGAASSDQPLAETITDGGGYFVLATPTTEPR
ncbi:MAG: hypothetical protein Tsb0020_17020 [Haliangiales bacterium]